MLLKDQSATIDVNMWSVRFNKIRTKTRDICAPLSYEDHVVQPTQEVSPPKWHLGHTTWFFEEFILKAHFPDYRLFNKNFSFVFNSYYETVGERIDRVHRGNITRPGVEEVLQYRDYVDAHIQELLDISEKSESIENLLELGLQHEQQHQELLYYDLKYILGHNPLFPEYLPKEQQNNTTQIPALGFIDIPGGLYRIGFEGAGFSFDNELGRHQVYVHDFQIMDRLVTNGEYFQFIEDGGYTRFTHWLADGWDWVNAQEIKAPLYWKKIDGIWNAYHLKGGMRPLNPAAPVTHLSHYEAYAYARWAGNRLPTEQEWEIAHQVISPEISKHTNLLGRQALEPMPKTGDNIQLIGDVWEWTGSAYLPYPYYKAPEGALGEYNGKFMSNQMVLRGGSFVTPEDHIRPTYRNFFQPELRWAFTGFRLARHI